jgi:protein required for attachment to host cells
MEVLMTNNLGLKMIAVIDLNKLRLYEAKGVKILKKIEELPLALHKEHRHEKGSYHNSGSSQGSAFEPHTSSKDLEHHDTAKAVVAHLDKVLAQGSPYTELMISAEPKTLGHVRSQLTNHLKKLITKEIIKDFAHMDMHEIEQAFFS